MERFPSLSSLSSSGGWLNQNIRYSVIPNRPSDCRSPMSSSRFGLDARLSKYRGLFPPSPPACRSWGAEPYPWDWGAAGGDTAGRGTRVSGRRRKAFQQRAAPKQEHHQRDLHQSSLSSFKAQLGFSLRSFLWDSQQRSSLRYRLSLEQIKDANGEAAGLLWCYPLCSKTYTSSRGRKVVKLQLKLGKDGLQNLVGVFRNLKWD